MPVTSVDDIIARVGAGFQQSYLFSDDSASTNSAPSNTMVMQRIGNMQPLPSLPAGVSGYVPTCISLMGSISSNVYLIGKLVNLGSEDLGANTFTDGSTMGTATIGNTSQSITSPVFYEVTSTIGGTSPTITITYKRSSGDTNQTAAAQSITSGVTGRATGWVLLNAGDTGVYDIVSCARGGTTPSGVVKFWGIQPIALVNGAQGVGGGITVHPLVGGGQFVWQKFTAADQVSGICVGSIVTKRIDALIDFIADS